ncbi:NAD-dependent epimerase/dehydratase family protein [Bordetella avium]|nr:NAD-dependent epimerase/dehydratase family protein [Bordetella avium]RIQ70921.1 NAD-dependent epimerase/dehydratase family protein [Bordetella avium]
MIEVSSGNAMPRAPIADVEAITAIARADLSALRGARIFITGGTGYIGRWLLESLCHANRVLDLQLNATVLSRKPAEFAEKYPHLAHDPCMTLIKGDVRDFSCKQEGFSHAIHAATDVVASHTPLEVFDVTVAGTRHVLEFARRQGIANVLMLSSGAVYGRFPDNVDRASESLPCVPDVTSPRSAYGLGKIATEWLGNAYGQEYGVSCKSARVFAQIGPYLELGAHFAAGNFIRDALQGDAIIIQGDGTALRSYMYAIDMVTWLWAILVRGKAGAAYNVGSELGVSIRDLAQAVVHVTGKPTIDIKVLGQPAPGAAPSRYIPDTTLAREELGLSITVPFEDAIRRTLEWYREQIKSPQT